MNQHRYLKVAFAEHHCDVLQMLPDLIAAAAEVNRANKLQRDIWARAVDACKETGSPAVMSLVLGSLNEMIDIANTRTEGSQMHPPTVIPVMLVVLVACRGEFVSMG